MRGHSTKAVHGPRLRRDAHGALRPPLYDSVAFEFESSRDLELAFSGKKPAHTYSRITNPTVEELEQRVRLISDAFGVVALSSGMAAIANTAMALARGGSNIVTTRRLFGHTLQLFSRTLARWGLETRFADMTDPESVHSQIDENTAFVYAEIISNPQLEITDVCAVCEAAEKKSVPVILDGTLTTPFLFDSKSAGVAVEIISSTKYISGGAGSVGGLIIDNGVFDWRKAPALEDISGRYGPGAFLMHLRREVFRNTGACLSAHNAWLQILGLETLPLRIAESSRNALIVAQFLQSADKVITVNYPGLDGSQWHDVAAKQFTRGFGGILTFELSGKEESFAFMDNLKLIRKATNLNDNKSLIIHPASTIFAEFSSKDRLAMGISEGLVRLSVGIEDVEDLFDDIYRGLDAI